MSERDYLISKAFRGPVNIHRRGVLERVLGAPSKKVQAARNQAYTANRQAIQRSQAANPQSFGGFQPTRRDYAVNQAMRGSRNYGF